MPNSLIFAIPFSLICKGLSFAFQLFALKLIASRYTDADFGALTLSLAVTLLASSLINNPSYQVILRRFPFQQKKDQREYVISTIVRAMLESFLTFFVSISAAWLLAQVLEIETHLWIILTGIYSSLYGIQIYYNALLRASNKQAFLDSAGLIDPILKCICLLFIGNQDFAVLSIIYSSSTLCVSLLCLYGLTLQYNLRLIDFRQKHTANNIGLPLHSFAYLIHYDGYRLAWMAASFSSWAYTIADRLTIQANLGLAELGAYGYILQIFYSPIVVVSNQFLAITEPHLFQKAPVLDNGLIITNYLRSASQKICIIAIVCCLIGIYPLIMYSIFGSTITIEPIWAYLLVLAGVSHCIGQILILEFKFKVSSKQILYTLLGSNLIGIILCVALTSAIGLRGGVLSVFFAAILQCMLALINRKHCSHTKRLP